MDKADFIDGLQEEYKGWQALLDQIGLERMDQPGVAGGWSIKDIVAHLTGWRRRTVARLQAAQHGDPEPSPPWPAHLQTDDEINAWIYEANRERSVREVMDESHQVFQQLLAAIEGLPDQAFLDAQHYLPWLEGSPFTPATFFSHFHEEHEPDMRAWLAQMKK
jgi:hypothetical protein